MAFPTPIGRPSQILWCLSDSLLINHGHVKPRGGGEQVGRGDWI